MKKSHEIYDVRFKSYFPVILVCDKQGCVYIRDKWDLNNGKIRKFKVTEKAIAFRVWLEQGILSTLSARSRKYGRLRIILLFILQESEQYENKSSTESDNYRSGRYACISGSSGFSLPRTAKKWSIVILERFRKHAFYEPFVSHYMENCFWISNSDWDCDSH